MQGKEAKKVSGGTCGGDRAASVPSNGGDMLSERVEVVCLRQSKAVVRTSWCVQGVG